MTALVTIGGQFYQVYASVAQADAYLAVEPAYATAWAALSDDDKAGRLVFASRRVDSYAYSGALVAMVELPPGSGMMVANLLQFPRTGTRADGVAYPADTPLPVQQACMLVAGEVTANPTAASGPTGAQGAVRRVSAGGSEVEYFEAGGGGAAPVAASHVNPQTHGIISNALAYDLLRPFFAEEEGQAARASGTAFGTPITSPGTPQNPPDTPYRIPSRERS